VSQPDPTAESPVAAREAVRPLQRLWMARGRPASLPSSYTTTGDVISVLTYGSQNLSSKDAASTTLGSGIAAIAEATRDL